MLYEASYDRDGHRLDAYSTSLALHFEVHELPPCDEGWVLWLRGEDDAELSEESGRLAIDSTESDLVYGEDGSLSLRFVSEALERTVVSNGLPAPDGRVSVRIRCRRLAESAVDPLYYPPAVYHGTAYFRHAPIPPPVD